MKSEDVTTSSSVNKHHSSSADVFDAFDDNDINNDNEDDVFDIMVDTVNNNNEEDDDEDPFADSNFDTTDVDNHNNNNNNNSNQNNVVDSFDLHNNSSNNNNKDGNDDGEWDDIWDKVVEKSITTTTSQLDQAAINPKSLQLIFNKVGRKVCAIKYKGVNAKLTAKGIMCIAGGNSPLFFQDAASFAKFVNSANDGETSDDGSWDLESTNAVLDEMCITLSNDKHDGNEISLRTIMKWNQNSSNGDISINGTNNTSSS